MLERTTRWLFIVGCSILATLFCVEIWKTSSTHIIENDREVRRGSIKQTNEDMDRKYGYVKVNYTE